MDDVAAMERDGAWDLVGPAEDDASGLSDGVDAGDGEAKGVTEVVGGDEGVGVAPLEALAPKEGDGAGVRVVDGVDTGDWLCVAPGVSELDAVTAEVWVAVGLGKGELDASGVPSAVMEALGEEVGSGVAPVARAVPLGDGAGELVDVPVVSGVDDGVGPTYVWDGVREGVLGAVGVPEAVGTDAMEVELYEDEGALLTVAEGVMEGVGVRVGGTEGDSVTVAPGVCTGVGNAVG